MTGETSTPARGRTFWVLLAGPVEPQDQDMVERTLLTHGGTVINTAPTSWILTGTSWSSGQLGDVLLSTFGDEIRVQLLDASVKPWTVAFTNVL